MQMIKTFEIVHETVIVLQPGAKVTVECDKPDDVKIAHRPPKSNDYDEREYNMIEFIHAISKLNYLDKVIDMYNNLNASARVRVMDALEWTKYKKDFFIRDFIAAVNKEHSNKENHLVKG
jgi:hypothetical protein